VRSRPLEPSQVVPVHREPGITIALKLLVLEETIVNTTKVNWESLDLSRLSTLRDELKVKAHLFDSELKSQWEKLEKDWELIQAEMKRIAPDAKMTIYRSTRSTLRLFGKIERSLHRIREGLERHHRAAS
jgi:hypothetical protein